jgi:UTP--glucose-1-phosphate uridylyltransferase
LKSLQKVLKTNNNVLELPMIVNTKPVDPKDPDSFKVYQLETAMGAAISVFEGADALLVPRSRFAPVKTTDDLLAVRSDYYVLTEDYRVIVNPKRKMKPLIVNLDNDYYKLVDDLNHRIPHPPSLLDCEKLIVKGDFLFGKNLKFKGIVELINESGNQKSLEQI